MAINMMSPALYDYDDIKHAISFVDPNLPRDEWAKIAMSLKSELGDSGFVIFDDWSSGGESYKAADTKATWRSVKAGGVISINYLMSRAKKAGWKSPAKQLSDEEKQRRKKEAAERAEARKKRDEVQEKNSAFWHALVAARAKELFARLPNSGACPYLDLKKVGAFGDVRFVQHGIVILTDIDKKDIVFIEGKANIEAFFANKSDADSYLYIKRGALVLPLFHPEHGLVNLQFILPPTQEQKSKKLFMKFGRKSGCSFAWGVGDSPAKIMIGEGYATLASCYLATGWGAVVAFDCGNLESVAGWIRTIYPTAQIVIVGDDDVATQENAGRAKALRVGAAFNAAVVFPEFAQV